MDEDGYPEDEVLNFIKSYNLAKEKTVDKLLEVIKENWNYADIKYFTMRKGKDVLGDPCMKLQLHTGGWSGNESIIDAIQNGKFPTLWIFWTKSKAGGHYYFDISLSWFKNKK